MQVHDEERDIYGVVYVQGMKYFLLENRPTVRPLWLKDGYYWLVALNDMNIHYSINISWLIKTNICF